MLRSLASHTTSLASDTSRACTSCSCMPPSRRAVPLTPLTAALSPSLRSFSSSPTPRRRGGPIKVVPDFDWRRPFKGVARPQSIEIAETEEEANRLLESLTSTRLSIDLEPGHKLQASLYALGGLINTTRAKNLGQTSSTSEGVFSVADSEGIIVLHTAKMKYAPQKLLDIMEDPHIEKQAFGGVFAISEFLHAPDFFRNARPSNILCLRGLATTAYPTLDTDEIRGLPNMHFASKLAEELGTRFVVASGEPDYHIHKLQGPHLHRILNQTWFTHCAGLEIREAYHKRTDKVLSRNSELLKQRHLFADAAEEMLEHFTFDTDEVEAALRRQGKL
ncbi:hypothetical protein JCM6882_000752 [Rhodosporidiobolus microsporus]